MENREAERKPELKLTVRRVTEDGLGEEMASVEWTDGEASFEGQADLFAPVVIPATGETLTPDGDNAAAYAKAMTERINRSGYAVAEVESASDEEAEDAPEAQELEWPAPPSD